MTIIDELADDIDIYYETEDRLDDLWETASGSFSNGDAIDFSYFAYISIRDLRDSDDPAPDLYQRWMDLPRSAADATIFALATRFYTHLMGR